MKLFIGGSVDNGCRVTNIPPAKFPAEQVEGLYSCLDYYQNVSDPFSRELLTQYDKLYPGADLFGAQLSGPSIQITLL